MARKNNKITEEAFAAAYVANGLNGTQAYKSLRPDTSNQVAGVQSTRLLKKDNVVKSIEALLPSVEEELKVIAEALGTPRPKTIDWKDTHKFVETRLKLRGLLDKSDKSKSVNVGVFINTPDNKAQ